LLVPFQLITGFVQLWALEGVMQQAAMEEMAESTDVEVASAEVPIWFFPWSIITSLIGGLVILPLTNAAVIQAVARLYLGQPVTPTEAIRHGLHRLLALIGTTILLGLAIMGGFMLLVIPGILCMIWFGLSQHVVVLENLAGTKALGRSKKLVGPRWATFLVLALLVMVISMAIQGASYYVPQPHLRIVVAVLLTAVVTIISTAAWVVFYFSCRCAEENFDLHYLAEAIGEAPTAADEHLAPPVR
jgi:hypothetical protein